jgi:hypothetical protein
MRLALSIAVIGFSTLHIAQAAAGLGSVRVG